MTSVDRFPITAMTGLLDDQPRFNLAESVGPDLEVRQLLELGFAEELKKIKLGYATSQGDPSLRAVLAKRLEVTAENVFVSAGAQGGLFLLIFLSAGPGDEVITVTPNFPPIIDSIKAAGAKPVLIPTRFEEGHQLAPERFEPVLNSKTKLVILVSPGNPSGVSCGSDKLGEIYALVKQRAPNARLVVDETYRLATYKNHLPVPCASSLFDDVISVSSLSKCHGAPGLRIGWLVSNDLGLREKLAAGKLGTQVTCGTIDEAVARFVLEHQDEILEPRKAVLSEGVELTEAWVRENEDLIEWIPPDAGALCLVRFKPGVFEGGKAQKALSSFLAQGVKVSPAAMFGGSALEFRLGFGFLPMDEFRKALAGMTSCLRGERN